MGKNPADPKTVIIEGPEMLYQGLCGILSPVSQLKIEGRAEDTPSALEMLKKHKPQLLVKELNGRQENIEAQQMAAYRKASLHTNLVVIADNPSPQKVRESLQAGAKACLCSRIESQEMQRALQTAADGDSYIDAEIAAQLITEQTMGLRSRLTPREAEVLKETALGYTSQEIGEKLYMSKRTVESHRASINNKLGFRNRAALVSYAIEEQIIP